MNSQACGTIYAMVNSRNHGQTSETTTPPLYEAFHLAGGTR